MEARETTVPPHRSQPEVSATAAAIAIVGGVGVFVASAILSYWANRSDLTAAVIVSSIGLWASIVSIYLVETMDAHSPMLETMTAAVRSDRFAQ